MNGKFSVTISGSPVTVSGDTKYLAEVREIFDVLSQIADDVQENLQKTRKVLADSSITIGDVTVDTSSVEGLNVAEQAALNEVQRFQSLVKEIKHARAVKRSGCVVGEVYEDRFGKKFCVVDIKPNGKESFAVLAVPYKKELSLSAHQKIGNRSQLKTRTLERIGTCH